MAKFIKLGDIMKSKKGGLYIKVDNRLESLNVNGQQFKGEYINLEKPQVKYERMLEKGTITEDEYETKVAAIPDFVKYEVTVVLD